MLHSTLNNAMSTSEPDMSICNQDERISPLNSVGGRRRIPASRVGQGDHHFEEFRLEMRKLITTFTISQREDMRELKTAMNDIQESNKSIEASISYLTSQNEELKQKIGTLENMAKEDREYIIFLEEKLEDLQLLSRKTNFEIKGVPKKEKETKQDLVEIVVTLSKNIGCEIANSDIKDIYRVRGRRPEQRNTPIIVETGSVLLKTEFLKMAKSFNVKHHEKLRAKHLGFKTQEDTPIFLSENLTYKGSRLHYLARDLAKSKGYRFVWTSYGKVYVRKQENSPIVWIKSEEQVRNLLSEPQ